MRQIQKQSSGLLAKLARLARRSLVVDQPRAERPARFLDCVELEDRLLFSAAPVGHEALVNTTTSGTQQALSQAAVASDANGNYVVTWASQGQDGSGFGIYAQRFNAAGQAQGNEIQVNTTTTADQLYPAIAMSSSGTFVITWSDDSAGNWDVRAQQFDASGNTVGSEFVVNTTTAGDEEYSDIAMDAAGNFVITWSDDSSGNWGVRAQRYNSSDNAVGGQMQVNTFTTGDQEYSTVAMDNADNFAITWSSNGQDGSGWGIYAQQFNWSGSLVGSEFQVNTTTSGDQEYSRVAMSTSGAFAITWGSDNQDGSGWGIYAQQYNASGTAVGSEFQVNTTTIDDQEYSSIYMDPRGNFTIAWSDNSTGDWDVKAQEFDVSDNPIGSEFLVNTTTSGSQWFPSLDYQVNGNYVIVWSGNGVGDGDGVFMQQFNDGTNQPPVNTVPGAQSTNENTPLVFSTANSNALSISDVDADGNAEQVTLSVSDGTLTLGGTSGLTFSTGTGTANATMTFTGTLTNINSALSGLVYTPTNAFIGTDSLQVSTNDLGNTGTGGAQTTTSSIALTVNAYTNQAPVNTVPGAQTTNENTSLVFSTATSNAISVSDVDADGNPEQITLSVSNGTLTLSGTTGLTFTGGTHNGNATMTFTGTLASINAALDGLTYNPIGNYYGSDSLAIITNDLGYSGAGGAKTDSSSVGITIGQINQPPVNTVPSAQTTNENVALVFSTANSNAISVSDVDSGGSAEQLSLSVSDGTLTLAATTGLTFNSGSNGAASMTFTGTLANINAALNGLTYTPTSSYFGSDSLAITSNDLGNSGAGGAKTDSSSVGITVREVNQAPVNTVPGAQSTNENVALVFSTATSNAISVSDVDSGGNSEQLTLSVSDGTLTLSGTSGLTFIGGTHNGNSLLTFTGTLANINAALNGLTYTPTSSYFGSDSLSVTSNDLGNTGVGGPKTNSSSVAITVAQVNQAPVNTVPAAQTTNENVALVFSTANSNVISVSDVDSGGSAEQLALSVSHGTLTLAGTSGLTFTSGSNGAASMTFTGTLANIDAALDGLTYTPTTSYYGSDSLAITSNDLGNTGLGGAKTDSSSVAITVGQVNQAPVNTVPGAQSTNENVALVFSTANSNVISVSDVDSGGSAEQLSLSVSDGTVTLAGTSGLTFTSGSNGAAAMTFTGTLANIDAALNGLTYAPTSSYYGSDSLSIASNDLGNTGSGGAKTDSSSVAITVAQVNQAPVNTVPSAQSTNENVALVFSTANSNAISVSDVDSGGSSEQLSLSVSDGTLTLAGTSGLTFTSGSNGAAAMTFTGTLANINAALNGLTYTPTSSYHGSDSLSVTSNDLGNTGLGGAKTDSSSVAITVAQVNQAPVNTVPSAQSTNENVALVFSTANSNAISVSDVDSGGSSEQLSLSVSDGTLTLAGTSGLTFTGGSNGAAAMTFTGTLANINAALNGLTYTPTTSYYGSDSLSITSNDLGNTGLGGAKTDSSSVAITVAQVNQAPVNTVPSAQSTNENVALVFSTANSNAISVSDVDSGGSSEQLSLSVSDGTLTLAGTSGLTFTSGSNGAASMTFTGTLANLNAALNGLTYTPTTSYFGSDSLAITSNDLGHTGLGGAKTDSSSVAITVAQVNQAPVNTVPGAQSTNENVALVFSTANSNAISVSDVDSGGSSEQLSLSVSDGTLTLAGTSGLTFTSGSNGAASMTFTGTLANINAALNGLTYTPTTSYFGSDSLSITSNDLGHTGLGGAKTDSSSVAITVAQVNQPPVNTVPSAQSTNENVALVFSTANSNAISVSDVDSGGSSEQLSLSVSDGTLTLAGTSGLTFTSGSNGAASMTFTGTLANINAALNGLTYTPTTSYYGSDSLAITSNDLGHTGLGGAKTDSSSVAITVAQVNQAPVNTVPSAQSTNEDVALVFSAANSNAISVSDVDSGGSAEQLSLSVSDGTLTLAGTSGLTFSGGTHNTSASMTFTGTLANINAALNGLTYTPTSSYYGSDSLAITTNDLGHTGLGGAKTDSSSVAITVAQVNQAPINTAPGAQSINENVTLVFSSANSNAISVSDIDAAGSAEQLSLSVSNGTLSLATTSGLTFSTGTGSGDASMTFTGTLANINAALDGLAYAPTTNYVGSDSLIVTSNDLGNTGLGGAKSDASSVAIAMAYVNEAPVNNMPGAQALNQDTQLVFSSANGNTISVSDPDAGSSPVQIDLSVSQGTLSLAGTSGLTMISGSGTGDTTMTFSGSLASINTALNGLVYTPTAGFYGGDTLHITTNDLGHTGAGGPQITTDAVAVTVVQVDHAPIVSVPGSQIAQNDVLLFSIATGNAISVSENGPGGQVIQLTLTSTAGSISLPSTSGITMVSGDAAGSGQLVFKGDLASVNNALDGLAYQPAAMNSSLQIVAVDLGAPPAQQTTSTSVAITQTPLILLGTSQNDTTSTATTAAKSNSDTIVAIDPRLLSSLDSSLAAPPIAAQDLPPMRKSTAMIVQSTTAPLKVVQVNEQASHDAGQGNTDETALLMHTDARLARRLLAGNYRRAGLLDSEALWGNLETIANQFKSNAGGGMTLTVGAAAGVTAALSAGYVVWCLRAGTLLASVLSSLPMWRNFDPLPVLEYWEKKSTVDDESDDDDELAFQSQQANREEAVVG